VERFLKLMRVRGGFKFCIAGADKKFQPPQDSSAVLFNLCDALVRMRKPCGADDKRGADQCGWEKPCCVVVNTV